MIYGDITEAGIYHTARGNGARWDAITNQLAALVNGSDYVDQRYRVKLKSGRWVSEFPGVRTAGRDQDREWPRTGAKDYEGEPIPADVVPQEVEYASYEAALIDGENPGSLSPAFVWSELVTREKVGPIEVAYAAPPNMDGTLNRPIYPKIDEIIAPVLVPRYDFPAVRVV